MRVLSFGEVLLRLAAPGYTRLFQKNSLDASFCGAEANVAVSLAQFGLESAFLTKLPDGPVGQAAVNAMRYFGVDTGRIIYGPGRMGLYYLEKGASQRPSRVIYDRAHSAIALARPEEFCWDALLDGVGWFHWTGINPALSENMAQICMDACRAARSRGVTVSCDLNYRESLWSSAMAQSVMAELMPYVDVCIANEEDGSKVLGIKPRHSDVETGKLDRAGYQAAAEEICQRFHCKYVAVTLRESYSASINGWSGMLYSASEGKSCFSRKYDIQLVDRVGGGDSFGAGLIYALATGMPAQRAVEFAAAASCLKQTIEGDFNRCSAAEVEALLASGGNGRVQR